MTPRLDAIDLLILDQLQSDAKLTNVELATRIRLSPSPCLARVRAMESAGVVRRYVTLVDPVAMGFGVSVFIEITLEKQVREALESFEAAMLAQPEVMECYLMTGNADYLIRVVVRDVQALERFVIDKLTSIRGIASIRSSFALKQVKYETALPLPVPRSTPRKTGAKVGERPSARKRRASATKPGTISDVNARSPREKRR